MENKLSISIFLFTFPNLEQLPGGVDIDVADVDELTKKIPELVQSMMKNIENNLPKPPQPKTPPKKVKTSNSNIIVIC